tara:strand:+ start:316 stop:558 length:243 start_codon:yes stop_codon:yes gene_type:complete
LLGVISAEIRLGRAYKACYEIDSHYQRNEIADFFSYFAEGFKFEIFFNYHTLEYAISMPKLSILYRRYSSEFGANANSFV